MRDSKFVKDTISVVFSNALVLFSSIMTGLIVPDLLGVTGFGYYRTFTLYLGYCVLLHFGFVDGVLLEYAGKNYDELNKKKMRAITLFYFVMQVVVAGLIFFISLFVLTGITRILFFFIAIDTLFVNCTCYFQYVSQSTMRFKELSIRKVLQAFLKVLTLILIIVLYKIRVIENVSVYLYVLTIVLIDFLLLGWYVISYRDIIWGERERIVENKNIICGFFKKGIMLTFAYQLAHLVFSLDSQFVVALYDTDTYSIYAFAYSLITMFTTVIGAVSYVLFPSMKQKSAKENIKLFSDSIALISTVVFAVLSSYSFLELFISLVLKKYIYSLEYIRIIFPGLAISCCINIIIFTYFKVLDKIRVYFQIGCVVLFLAAGFNYLAYIFFHSPSAISIASIITLFIWYLLTSFYFVKEYQVNWIKNTLYILIMSGTFWLSTINVVNSWVGTLMYSLIYFLTTYFLYRRVILKYLRKLR